MQLMPETAKELGVTNPFDISRTLTVDRYLRQMLIASAAISSWHWRPTMPAPARWSNTAATCRTRKPASVKRVLRFAVLQPSPALAGQRLGVAIVSVIASTRG
jgi:hypothetical protein